MLQVEISVFWIPSSIIAVIIVRIVFISFIFLLLSFIQIVVLKTDSKQWFTNFFLFLFFYYYNLLSLCFFWFFDFLKTQFDTCCNKFCTWRSKKKQFQGTWKYWFTTKKEITFQFDEKQFWWWSWNIKTYDQQHW